MLWGVTAARDGAGIDRVVAHPGVADPPRLLARLQDLTGQATSPGVVGVDHRILQEAGSPSFVASYIPQSDTGPHMARLGENRYYQRIGSSTLQMEHFQIADMFGRRAQPKLALSVEQIHDNMLIATLRNDGRGAAMAPFVMFEPRAPYIVASYPETGKPADFPLPKLVASAVPGWGAFVGNMNHVLHPGMTARFRAITPPGEPPPGGMPTHCYVRFRFGAVGTAETIGHFAFDFRRDVLEEWHQEV